MCFRKTNKLIQYIAFCGCLLVVCNSFAVILKLPPIAPKITSPSLTPFPPQLIYENKLRSSVKKNKLQQSLVSNTFKFETHKNTIKLAKGENLTVEMPKNFQFSPFIINPMALNLSLSLISLPPLEAPIIPNKQLASTNKNESTIWASMSEDFSMDHYVNRSEVNAQMAIWQRNKKDLYQLLKTAAPYISYVYEQTKKQGLPAELALLPIIESEFNPHNRSNKGATGIWQIMPGTASDLGLKNRHGYDGRRDIVASTNAALSYLRSLHKTLGSNWQLALAAYNWGPGKVQAAVNRRKLSSPSSFWNLQNIPKETRAYVPKLLALAEMIQNPKRYHITLPIVENGPQLALVKVDAHVDLKQIAASTGISVKTMRQLNPGYSNMYTVPGVPNTLLIPIEKIALLKGKKQTSAWISLS